MERDTWQIIKSSLPGIFVCFIKKCTKISKIYKKLVESYCENTEQKMR